MLLRVHHAKAVFIYQIILSAKSAHSLYQHANHVIIILVLNANQLSICKIVHAKAVMFMEIHVKFAINFNA
jgi:hypothetical protein